MLRRRTIGLKTHAGDLRRGGHRRSDGRQGDCAGFDLSGLSLARRYLLLSLVFVVIGGGVVAPAPSASSIETSAINRTTAVTALYVESFVAPELQIARDQRQISAQPISARSSASSTDTPLGAGGGLVPDLVDGWRESCTARSRISSANDST